MIVCQTGRLALWGINTPLHCSVCGRNVEDSWSDGAVIRGGEVFGVVVGEVNVARCPKNVEVTLADAVADPVETHVHGAAAFLFDCVIGDTIGACIVGLDWGWRLRVSHGDEDGAEHFRVFGIVEECSEFGFSC